MSGDPSSPNQTDPACQVVYKSVATPLSSTHAPSEDPMTNNRAYTHDRTTQQHQVQNDSQTLSSVTTSTQECTRHNKMSQNNNPAIFQQGLNLLNNYSARQPRRTWGRLQQHKASNPTTTQTCPQHARLPTTFSPSAKKWDHRSNASAMLAQRNTRQPRKQR